MPDQLADVYTWLVEVVAFPFDFSFGDKPGWMDVHRLAAAWQEFEGGQDAVEDYVDTIYDETGWSRD